MTDVGQALSVSRLQTTGVVHQLSGKPKVEYSVLARAKDSCLPEMANNASKTTPFGALELRPSGGPTFLPVSDPDDDQTLLCLDQIPNHIVTGDSLTHQQ